MFTTLKNLALFFKIKGIKANCMQRPISTPETLALPMTTSAPVTRSLRPVVSNAVLKRLAEEVKYENQNNILAYNRTHNRHNRGR